jgi:tripartite-type tricarboxylate transporter receptor subunit TctC
MRTLLLVSAVACGLGTLATQQTAAAADNSYKGKTIELDVGFGPGGGYDIYARALAKFLPNHLSGTPTVIVRNVPGAGSLRLVKNLYAIAPKDGTSIGTFDPGLIIAPLLDPDKVNLDFTRLAWIGSIAQVGNIIITSSKSPIKNWNDLLKNPSTFAATGTSDKRYGDLATVKNMFHAKMQIIPGYKGSNEIFLAMERGEVSGTGIGYATLMATGQDISKFNMIIQLTLNKAPELPNVPLLSEKATSDKQRAALRLLFAPNLAGRPFAAPPGLAAGKLKDLRGAFDAIMKDPKFLEFAQKSQMELQPVTGKEIEEFIQETYRSPKDVVALAASVRL